MLPNGFKKNPSLATLPVIFALAIVVFSSISPSFLTGSNLLNIAVQGATTAAVAVAMTFVIITSGIDLSVGSGMLLGGVLLALGAGAGIPVAPLFLLVIVASVCAGLLNGLLIGRLGLNPLLVTIGSYTVFGGVGNWLISDQLVNIPAEYHVLGTDNWLGVPTPLWVTAAVIILGILADRFTPLGRLLRAIGSNPGGAKESGIRIKTITMLAYVLVGVTVGISALITAGQLGEVDPTVGKGFELTVITAVVLGGTALNGGSGSIMGSVLGAFLLATVKNGLVLSGASPYWYDVILAAVLILAVSAVAIGRKWPAWVQGLRQLRTERPLPDLPPGGGTAQQHLTPTSASTSNRN
jgi:ribose/xylose/arabinose/galactoside ABC-type transport system permease subunit